MTKEVIWSPDSENDIKAILDYLEKKWNNTIIVKFLNKVDDTINLILEDPQIFPVINEELQIRKSVITKQITLYYRELVDKIEIVRIFDTRQDPKKLEFKH
jgi:plasmid stabilization system protein ParE